MSRVLKVALAAALAASALAVAHAYEVVAPEPRTACASGVVKVVGAYSNIRETPGHVYGFGVDLWRCGDDIIGLMRIMEGQQADFRTDRLNHVTFDPKSGALSFDAWGDEFKFSGRLAKDALAGQMKRTRRSARGDVVTRERVTLARSRSAGELMRNYASYEEWKAFSDDILKRLGPRR